MSVYHASQTLIRLAEHEPNPTKRSHLFAGAAALQEGAVLRLPEDRAEAYNVFGRSAVVLWARAGLPEQARRLARTLLASGRVNEVERRAILAAADLEGEVGS